MRTAALALVLGIAASALLARPTVASAQEDAARAAEAESLFRRGVALGEIDRWGEAHDAFAASYALVERPTTLFNIAYSLFRTGHHREAVARFDELLARPDVGARRDDARRLRETAAELVGELTIEVSPAEAALEVDGVPVEGTGTLRTLPIDPGLHRVVARAPGYADRELDVSVVPGEHLDRQISLSQRSPSVMDEPVFWVGLGAGIAVLVTGVVIGVAVASSGPSEAYGGSSGVVVEALRF